MRIGWIEVLKKVYGETFYSGMAQSVLSQVHALETINVCLDQFKKYLYPKILYRLCCISGQKEIWIRNFESILTMPYDRTQGKNIALIHHIDDSVQPSYLKPPLRLLEKTFYHHLKKADALITVSTYWQTFFMERGYPKVDLIHNAFDLEAFDFKEEELIEFKKRHSFEEKPVVYLGNCQRIKGVVEVYEQLKGLEVHLVTSGQQEVNLPVLHLNLSYKDYLLLLKSSAVVLTMSKFKEGWNRTAHEAMLCKTPVIGSGLGGMRELLEGGGQVICEDFSELKGKVLYMLEHPEWGEKGYEFAKQFTLERFREAWLSLIQRVHEEE